MTDRTITRRTVLQGGAALTGALALGNWREGEARQSKERPTLIVFWLNGGPAGLFNSADSFLRSGAFGVAESNVRYLGNDLRPTRRHQKGCGPTRPPRCAWARRRSGPIRARS